MTSAILLSGGQDSIAIAYWLRPKLAITIDYGQLAAVAEVRAAKQVCSELSIEHHVVSIDCSPVGSGDMARQGALEIAPSSEWWPFRNQLLITLAAGKSVGLGVKELLIGAVLGDAGHSDGTQQFIQKMSMLLEMQEGGIRVRAPAIHMSSAELVRESGIPMSLLMWAHSCHRADAACGRCRGCIKHKNVIFELGHEPF